MSISSLELPTELLDRIFMYWGRSTSLQPVKDDDALTALGLHGARLRDAMLAANIAASHHPLIIGLFLVYRILDTSRYSGDNKVLWPPQEALSFDAEYWRAMGFDEEVVKLLPYLPYVDWYDGEIAPGARFISYVETDRSDMRNVFNESEVTTPPWMFRFTDGLGGGRNYVYNTRDGTIAIWNVYEVFDESTKDFLQQPAFPAEEVLGTWLQQLVCLTYVPSPDKGRMEVEFLESEPVILSNGTVEVPTDNEIASLVLRQTTAFQQGDIAPFDLVKHRINTIRARRRIYLDHGWDSDRFDADECYVKVTKFEEEATRLYLAMTHAVPREVQAFQVPHTGYIDPEQEYDKFLVAAAGNMAV